MDGFDHYETADIAKKWSSAGGWTPTLGTIYPGVAPAWAIPPGGQGLALGNAHSLSKVFPSNYAVGLIGFYYRYLTTPAAMTIASFNENTGAEQCSLRVDSTGHLLVNRASTNLATSTNTLSASTWYHIEFKATINNSTGQYEVRVNGSSTGWIPQSSANKNTRNVTNNYFYGFSIYGANGYPLFDDLYVLNCDASPNDTFLGPQKIITCYPRMAGTYAQWTPNYMDNFENVQETTADSLNTFNQSSTANQIDSFSMDQLPNATINGIQHVLFARQDVGAARQLAPFQYSSSTPYVGTTYNLTAGFVCYLDVKDQDPDAGPGAWTYANINASEFGYKLIA